MTQVCWASARRTLKGTPLSFEQVQLASVWLGAVPATLICQAFEVDEFTTKRVLLVSKNIPKRQRDESVPQARLLLLKE